MNEISRYGVLKEKLQGICNENDLTFSIKNKGYPFLLTIKPCGGMDAQQTMMEGMDSSSDTGYISPDASLVFAYRDGDLTYKISETFTISDRLFNKLKGLFRKMHDMWLQYFYRDIHEHSPTAASNVSDEIPESTSDADSVPENAPDVPENPTVDTDSSDSVPENNDFVTEEEDDDSEGYPVVDADSDPFAAVLN